MTTLETRKRPALLLLAMTLCTLLGMGGMLVSFAELTYYRSSSVPERPLEPGVDAAKQEAERNLEKAHFAALDHTRGTRLPLTVANLLLSGLLMIAASRASAGRPGSGSLALQAVGANALLTVAHYVLSRDYRAELIGPWVELVRQQNPSEPQLTNAQLAEGVWGSFRMFLVLTLSVYVVAALSLVRRPAREYLAPVGPGELDGEE